MSKISVCTIVAKNYLALATSLAESLHAFHPQVAFHTLVIDPEGLPTGRANHGAMILNSPADFFPLERFDAFTVEYDITELSTALKPFYMEHLLAKEDCEKVLYMDPDILILQPIDGIFDALDDHNIVLTPHLLDPIPLDGHRPSEISILQSGAYNLGFIGVAQSAETSRFLVWWMERLEKHCRNAVEEGLFVDQKWVDLVPGIFEGVRILKERGYNVAYWNLNARQLYEHDGVYFIDDEVLSFFHFSGFNADKPAELSKHQDRIEVKKHSPLAKLLQHYSALLKANGHDEYKRLPYTYAFFSNGVPVDFIARFLLKETRNAGLFFPHPFDVNATPSFFDWLNSPAQEDVEKESPHITNYLFGLYRNRPDLRAAFPMIFGKDRYDYLAWAHMSIVREGAHPVFVPAHRAADDSHSDAVSLSPGVNVAGYLTAESGLGEAARGYVAALNSLGVETALINFHVGTISRKADETLSGFGSENPFPINIVHVNADEVNNFIAYAGDKYFEGKYNIGIWAWELSDFPKEWRDRFNRFNEIWVGSNFMGASISKQSPLPVIRVPHVVHLPTPSMYPKSHFGIPESDFVFLFVFDFLSHFERKNPLAVVKAFKQAFRPEEPVRLVLKCINGEQDAANFKQLRDSFLNARISIIDDYLTKDEKNGLIGAADCYVSLHRAEGFGLTLAEAMLMEKPVIATGWSGNMDFMTINNSYPVEYKLITLAKDHGPYKQGQVWAEPNVRHAAQLMREVYERPDKARDKGERAATDIRSMHSPAAVGKVIKARLDVIKVPSQSVSSKALQYKSEPLPELTRLSLPPMTTDNNGLLETSHWGPLGLLSKKVVERLIRFYVDHQNAVNLQLQTSNRILAERLVEIQQRLPASIQSTESRLTQQQQLIEDLERQVEALTKQFKALR